MLNWRSTEIESELVFNQLSVVFDFNNYCSLESVTVCTLLRMFVYVRMYVCTYVCI